MRKTFVELDEENLNLVREILGTSTIKETVNRALNEVVRLEFGRRHDERLRTMDGLDLHDPEVMKGAWR